MAENTSNTGLETLFDSPAEIIKRRKKLVYSIVMITIVAHLLFGGVAAVWVVARYYQPPPATFKVHKQVIIPAREREHKMDLASHASMAPKPVLMEKVISTRPTEMSLPDMPEVPLDQMLPLNPSELISDQVDGLVGTAGTGQGGEGIGGLDGEGDALSFFGIQDKAKSVVIMIDVSSSMFGRTGDLDYESGELLRHGQEQAFQRVRDEAIALVNNLSINSRFGIIRWSGGAYSWKPELVPATDANKAEAIEHIQNRVDARTAPPKGGDASGTRHDRALQEMYKLKPEVAYMLSDGNATISTGEGRYGLSEIPTDELLDIVRTQSDQMEQPTRLHVIYYITGQNNNNERRMLRRISSATRGQFQSVRAAR